MGPLAMLAQASRVLGGAWALSARHLGKGPHAFGPTWAGEIRGAGRARRGGPPAEGAEGKLAMRAARRGPKGKLGAPCRPGGGAPKLCEQEGRPAPGKLAMLGGLRASLPHAGRSGGWAQARYAGLAAGPQACYAGLAAGPKSAARRWPGSSGPLACSGPGAEPSGPAGAGACPGASRPDLADGLRGAAGLLGGWGS